MYIHELSEWPRFHWDRELLADQLAGLRHLQGRLVGHMEALGDSLRQEAELRTLTADVLESSEIEGTTLDADQVRSSIAGRLGGMDTDASESGDRGVEGVVEVMLDATRHYEQALTEERLADWHAALFPTGPGGWISIRFGAWRDGAGAMQVVSGPTGKQRVLFEAVPAARVGAEMTAFLDWFNGPPNLDQVLRAALAHLWFVTIRPFDDGNGHFARAIADLTLARSENSPQRFYSMSRQIRQERDTYYEILEQTLQGTMDITAWMEWFLGCLGRAIDGAQGLLGPVLAKAQFRESLQGVPFNERQTLVLNRLLDGFEGNLTSSKYAQLAKCSQDTALRDIAPLVERGILIRGPEGGRSTSYSLAIR